MSRHPLLVTEGPLAQRDPRWATLTAPVYDHTLQEWRLRSRVLAVLDLEGWSLVLCDDAAGEERGELWGQFEWCVASPQGGALSWVLRGSFDAAVVVDDDLPAFLRLCRVLAASASAASPFLVAYLSLQGAPPLVSTEGDDEAAAFAAEGGDRAEARLTYRAFRSVIMGLSR